MRIAKFGHACLFVETDDARVLIDPGVFSSGLEAVGDLTAILITHAHGDHLDVNHVAKLVAANPGVGIFGDIDSARTLVEAGIQAQSVEPGQKLDVGTTVEVVGRDHAVIHPDLPRLINHGYLIGERLFHPGDALTIPGRDVDVLALPIGAPWLKSSEFIDYLRAVKPRRAVSIHDAVLAMPQMSHNLVAQLGPRETEYVVIENGQSAEV